MTLLRPLIFPLALAAWVGLGLAGCGVDEFSPDAGVPGARSAGDSGPPAIDDDSVTGVDMTVSVEYIAQEDRVRVFLVVKDQDGNPLTGLSKENFSVTPIGALGGIDPADMELDDAKSQNRVVALVIDSSGSMSAVTETGESRIQVARDAAKDFVGLMDDGDQTAVIDFDDDARVVQQLTSDREELNAAIDQFTASGATNLGAAVIEAVRAVGTRPGKRAAIIMTDGDDTVDSVVGGPDVWRNDAGSTRFQGLELARQNDLVVYTVGLGQDLSPNGLADLQTFADETGGRFFQAPTAAALRAAFQTTIPGEVDAQEPLETLVLSFDNPVAGIPGKSVSVPLRVGVAVQSAVGVLRDSFNGSYTVE